MFDRDHYCNPTDAVRSSGLTGGLLDGFRDNGANVFMVKVSYWIGM